MPNVTFFIVILSAIILSVVMLVITRTDYLTGFAFP